VGWLNNHVGCLLGACSAFRVLLHQPTQGARVHLMPLCLLLLPRCCFLVCCWQIMAPETAAHTISWVLYCLATHPEAEAKLLAELKQAGLPCNGDLEVGVLL
jgi:hypothetical protein